ncbi:MAG: hypothetical protein E3J72_19455 [Planctomycetota bacterium]|nr:MAG: hypothetical protein E3J72_19455 [Planctomycetota bacterium]
MVEKTMSMEDAIEAQRNGEGDENVKRENETLPQEEAAGAARCVHCGEGMAQYVLPRFNRSFGIVVLIVGIVLSIFMSLLLGLPLVVIGAYLGIVSRAVWMCRACGAVVERIKI